MPAALAAGVLLLHVAVNATSAYGFHRDELLYLAMGRHLRLWAMDFPPFIALTARATLETIGGSLVAVRLLPAVVHALLAVLAAGIARRLGGGAFAQGTAALAVVACPLFMRAGALFQPVVFDQLWWTLALLALAAAATGPRAWVLMGTALGVGLLTKFSIGFIGLGIAAAVLLTGLRNWLLTPWPWLAALLALAIGSPSIVGQFRLGYPVAAQMAELQGSQLERIGPAAFLAGNLEFLGPLVLLAIAGILTLIRRDRSPGEHAVAWAIAVTFGLLILLQGKAYYVGPVYPMLFAAGAVWVEARGRAIRWATVGVTAVFGLVTLPFGVPVLPPATMARYAAAVGLGTETNRGEQIALPQDYADMLGWEDQAAATVEVYRALSPAERRDAVVIGTNYGRAGAHDHLAAPLGLPAAVAPIGSYWFFGPGTRPGAIAIVIGGERAELLEFYERVEPAARVTGELRVNGPVLRLVLPLLLHRRDFMQHSSPRVHHVAVRC